MARDPVCNEVNAGELARIFGVSRKWVYSLEAKGMPRAGRLFDVALCVQWYLAELKGGGGDTEPEDLTKARLELYKAQTERTQLENARLRGELVELEEAQAVLYEVASVVATQHDGLAARLAGLVIGETDIKRVQSLLFEEFRELRRAIAGAVAGLAPPGGGDDPAAAEPDR